MVSVVGLVYTAADVMRSNADRGKPYIPTAVAYPSPPFLHTVAPFSDNDFTDVWTDLPAGVTSNQFSRVCGHPPRRPNSCRHWLEMRRCQATQMAVKWTLAAALQSAHCVVLLGCSPTSVHHVLKRPALGGGAWSNAGPAVWVVVLRAPPRVGQTTLGAAGRSVDVLVVGSPPPPSPRTVNRTALFRIGLGLKDRLTG